MEERRWPGQRSEMVTWLWALRNGCVSCLFLQLRPGPLQGGVLWPGRDGLGLRDVAAAYDCRVGGVGGLLGGVVRGDGLRSRT
jgi:hypothetical protein